MKNGNKIFFMLFDISVIYSGFAIAFLILSGEWQWNKIGYQNTVIWLSLIVLPVFYFFDLFSIWDRKNYRHMVISVFLAQFIITIATMLLLYWRHQFSVLGRVAILAGIIQLSLLLLIKTMIWYLLRFTQGGKKVLIVSQQLDDGIKTAYKLLKNTKGWFDVREILKVQDKNKIIKKLSDIDVIVVSPFLCKEDCLEITRNALSQGKEILFIPDPMDAFILNAKRHQIGDLSAISVSIPQLSIRQNIIKRCMDLFWAIILLAFFSPIMLLLYFLIPLTSPGPAIYKQQRIGRFGKPFLLLKFRSMQKDAEKETGPTLALLSDSRTTRIGRIIRASRLDELPQLFNVLKGDMSLVGPRPERRHFINEFKESIPEYEYRLQVKPGITGLAQVMGKYSTNVKYKIYYDLMYMQNYSLLLDLKIIFQTIPVMLTREQSIGIKETNTARERMLRNIEKASSEMSEEYDQNG